MIRFSSITAFSDFGQNISRDRIAADRVLIDAGGAGLRHLYGVTLPPPAYKDIVEDPDVRRVRGFGSSSTTVL